MEVDEERTEKRSLELIGSERRGVPRPRCDPSRVVAIHDVQQRTKPFVTDVMDFPFNWAESELGQGFSHFGAHLSLSEAIFVQTDTINDDGQTQYIFVALNLPPRSFERV